MYCIRNLINDKRYIGSTNHVQKRFSQHRRRLETMSHSNYKLQASWNKHGSNCFVFEVLEVCSEQMLSENESKCIEKFNSVINGYNLDSHTGRFSGTNLYDYWTKRYGKVEADYRYKQWRDKHSAAITGRSVNKGAIRKDLADLNQLLKSKSVVRYDLDWNVLGEYEGVREAARQLQISATGISRACLGELKTSNNNFWRYK